MPVMTIRIYREIDYAKKDRIITKAVPYISLAAFFAGLVLVFLAHGGEMGSLLLRFCSPFVVGFALLGAYAFVYRDRGAIDEIFTLIMILIVIPMLITVALIAVTSYIMPEIIDYFIKMTGSWADKKVAVSISIYSLTVLMMFMSHGVIATVVAYFRKYTARIYKSMEKIKNDAADTPRSKMSRWVYDIPNIIDIRHVELEPIEDTGRFPIRMFTSMAFSIFVLGLSISSYIFLNPIFQSALTLDETVMITAILTFFIPVLIIPWFITKDTGAKIKSQARDYYLWKGLKRRLYQGFFTIMVFLSLLAISVYLGYDLVRTSYTYAGYVLITAYFSLLYAFIYANYYHKGFREGIIREFDKTKNADGTKHAHPDGDGNTSDNGTR